MGTNSLSSDTDGGIASASDINQYKEAIQGDLVPRNASGVATDEAGSIGTSLLAWLTGYIKTLFVGPPANLNKIEADSGDIVIKVNDIEALRLTESGGQAGNATTPNQVSGNDSGGPWTNDNPQATGVSNEEDIREQDVEITTLGRPVLITLSSYLTETGVLRLVDNTVVIGSPPSYGCIIRLKRGATTVAAFNYISDSDFNIPLPLSVWDTPSAGTYTYKWTVQPLEGCAMNLDHIQTKAMELN